MISEDLANLADWLAGHAARKQDIGPAATAHMAKVILDLSRQARKLEDLALVTAQEARAAIVTLLEERGDGDD